MYLHHEHVQYQLCLSKKLQALLLTHSQQASQQILRRQDWDSVMLLSDEYLLLIILPCLTAFNGPNQPSIYAVSQQSVWI